MNFLTESLIAAVVLAVPLLLAASGELVAERSGVLNLGIDGMLLVGAATGFLAVSSTQSFVLGFLLAMVAGAAMGFIHAVFAVSLRANQIVSGLTLGILGTALSSFIGAPYVGVPLAKELPSLPIPLLHQIPLVGRAFFDQDVMVYLALVSLPLTAVVLRRTRLGSAVRACGSAPSAADASGLSVVRLRYGATVYGGMLAGLGGAYFSCVYSRVWSDNLTAGRGWIALALVIFASWRPLLLLPGAILFGAVDAMNFQLQARGVQVSADLLGMLPYVATLVALVLLVGRRRGNDSAMPSALGLPFERESRT